MAWIFMVLSFVGGAALAFQAGVNGEIGTKMGSLSAALIAYAVGTVCLLMSTLVQGGSHCRFHLSPYGNGWW